MEEDISEATARDRTKVNMGKYAQIHLKVHGRNLREQSMSSHLVEEATERGQEEMG